MDNRKLLLVRHGPDRGPVRNYFSYMFKRMAEKSPDFFSRIRFHETGTTPVDLGDVAAVAFLLGGPLEGRFPECYSEAKEIDDWARVNELPRLNTPNSLSNGRKSAQSRLWTQAGIPTPAAIEFTDREELRSAVEATGFPAVIRGDVMHSLRGLQFCRDGSEFESVAADIVFPGVVTPFVDTRASYRAEGRRDVWSKFYHKMRVFVVGNTVQPFHVFFARQPIINHLVSSYTELAGYPRLVRSVRKRIGSHRATLEEERKFITEEFEHAALMRRAAEILDFGFVAIDCARLADGSMMLWEANPHPYLPGYGKHMRRERNVKSKVQRLWDTLERHLQSLLEAGSPVERHVGTPSH